MDDTVTERSSKVEFEVPAGWQVVFYDDAVVACHAEHLPRLCPVGELRDRDFEDWTVLSLGQPVVVSVD
jgi:hypothetical protein